MAIFARVSEDHVGSKRLPKSLKVCVDRFSFDRKKLVLNCFTITRELLTPFKKSAALARASRFRLPLRAEDHPQNVKFWIGTRQFQDCATAPNLDVIRVSAQKKKIPGFLETQLQHSLISRPAQLRIRISQ